MKKSTKQGVETFRKWIFEVTNLDVKNYCSIASLGLDYIITQNRGIKMEIISAI